MVYRIVNGVELILLGLPESGESDEAVLLLPGVQQVLVVYQHIKEILSRAGVCIFFCRKSGRDEDPDPLIFGVSDPDPLLFSSDPDPTCNNGYIKLFSFSTKYKPESTNSTLK